MLKARKCKTKSGIEKPPAAELHMSLQKNGFKLGQKQTNKQTTTDFQNPDCIFQMEFVHRQFCWIDLLFTDLLFYIICRNGGNFQRMTFLKEQSLSFVKENTASIRIFSNILFFDR